MKKLTLGVVIALIALLTLASPADATVHPRSDYETPMTNCGTGARQDLIAQINAWRDEHDIAQSNEADDELYCNGYSRDAAQTHAQAKADAYDQTDGEAGRECCGEHLDRTVYGQLAYPQGYGEPINDSNDPNTTVYLGGQYTNGWTTDDGDWNFYPNEPGRSLPTCGPSTHAADCGFPSLTTWGHQYTCFSGVIAEFVPTYEVKFSDGERVTFGHSAPNSTYRNKVMHDLVYNDDSTNFTQLANGGGVQDPRTVEPSDNPLSPSFTAGFRRPGTIEGWGVRRPGGREPYAARRIIGQAAARFIGVGVVWKDVPQFTGPTYKGSGPGTSNLGNPGPGYWITVKVGTPGEASTLAGGQRESCDWIDYSGTYGGPSTFTSGWADMISHEYHFSDESDEVTGITTVSSSHDQLYPSTEVDPISGTSWCGDEDDYDWLGTGARHFRSPCQERLGKNKETDLEPYPTTEFDPIAAFRDWIYLAGCAETRYGCGDLEQ